MKECVTKKSDILTLPSKYSINPGRAVLNELTTLTRIKNKEYY